jgi:hypothetical protein
MSRASVRTLEDGVIIAISSTARHELARTEGVSWNLKSG